MLDQEQASVDGAAAVPGDDDIQETMKLSTGVVLTLRNPSPIAAATIIQEVGKSEPKPPRVFNKDKEREEDNPNDPAYKQARRIWLATAGLRTLRGLIPTGTAFESKPDDLVGPDDDDYLDLMASMGIDPGAGRYTRYVQWVLHVACGSDDIFQLIMALMRRAGVREEDIAEAATTFQGHPERTPDPAESA